MQNIRMWEKVRTVPLSRNCLQSLKVWHSMGDADDNQQALVYMIVEHKFIACNALSMVGYNGDFFKIMLKPIKHTNNITAPHMQDQIKLLSQAKTQSNIFATTSGVHLTAKDIFMGIALKQRKILRKKLAKEKTVSERQERIETIVLDIQERKGRDHTKLISSNLTILLTWHQHAKVATMKKEDKLVVWLAIINSRKVPPSFEQWTNDDDAKLLEVQSNMVKMAHTAIGHLKERK
jgi:hypothetical protein